MRVIILAGGYTKSEYFRDIRAPKCLLPIKDDRTILDLQMNKLSKYNFPITIVTGYDSDEVEEFCKSRGYNVTFVHDINWRSSYSLVRLVNELKYIFEGELILLFSDVLFNDDLLSYLVNSSKDICKCRNTFKFSSGGIKAMVEVLSENPDLEGLNTPMLNLIREKYPKLVIESNNAPIWQFDVDRLEDYNIIKMGDLKEG